MIILQFMDMKSTKFGGLGKFMIKLMESCPKDQFYFVFQSYPSSMKEVRRYKECGAKIEILNTETGIKAIRHIPQFVMMIKRIKPDIIHFHFANSFFIFAPIAKVLGIKHLFKTQHCCLTTGELQQVRCKKEFDLKTRIASWNGKVYNLFDRIIMCGKYVEKQFCLVYGASPKYQTIYFGVEPFLGLSKEDEKSLKKDLKIREDDIVVTTVAFADPIKGIDILIRALPFIDYDRFVVLLIGLDNDLKLTKDYRRMAEYENVSNKIRWIGITDNVNKYLSITDVYCQPSRSEALTLAVCEAKSAHLPVVGSNVGGLPEISNIVFDNENVKQLGQSLSIIIKNKELRDRMADQSYADYVKAFRIEKGVEAYCELYNSCRR